MYNTLTQLDLCRLFCQGVKANCSVRVCCFWPCGEPERTTAGLGIARQETVGRKICGVGERMAEETQNQELDGDAFILRGGLQHFIMASRRTGSDVLQLSYPWPNEANEAKHASPVASRCAPNGSGSGSAAACLMPTPPGRSLH